MPSAETKNPKRSSAEYKYEKSSEDTATKISKEHPQRLGATVSRSVSVSGWRNLPFLHQADV